jgi:hypothetical protein
MRKYLKYLNLLAWYRVFRNTTKFLIKEINKP